MIILAVALTVGCSDDGGAEADTNEDPTPFEQAVEALGGESALNGLELLQIHSRGTRAFDYEGESPGDVVEVSAYTTSFAFDLSNDDIRVDTERTPMFEALQFFPPDNFSIVVNGDVGGVSSQVGFIPPGPVPSQYVGALRNQQRYFNPHFMLREGLANPMLIGDGGEEEFDGRANRIITFAGDIAEVRLFVDAETGFISKLETLENHVLTRDTDLEVRYLEWQSQGALAFPNVVELYVGGQLVHDETRDAVIIEPSLAEDAFELPPEAVDAMLDPNALEFGQHTHHVVDAFFNLGAFYSEEYTIMPAQLAPGVTAMLVPGASNSVVVSYDQGLVVFEAPGSPAHGNNLIDAIAAEYPAMPITHLVQSHFHMDHSSGVRSFVAEDATLVVGDGVSEFWQGILAAESTIRPDALAGASVTPVIEEVSRDDTLVIDDPDVTITVHHISANPHSEDMVIGVIDTNGQRFVYEADLYNAGLGLTAVLGGPESLFENLRGLGIINVDCSSNVPLTIIPSHGIPQTLEDSLAELAGQDIDVGCN